VRLADTTSAKPKHSAKGVMRQLQDGSLQEQSYYTLLPTRRAELQYLVWVLSKDEGRRSPKIDLFRSNILLSLPFSQNFKRCFKPSRRFLPSLITSNYLASLPTSFFLRLFLKV